MARVNSQTLDDVECGNSYSNKLSKLSIEKQEALNTYQQNFIQLKSSKTRTLKAEENKIPLKIHIVRDSNGKDGLNPDILEYLITELNTTFKEAYISFYIFENIDFINNNDLNQFKKGNEDLLLNNYSEGIINIYFMDKVLNASEKSICGYNVDDIDKNIVVLKNSCATNGSSFAHEIGHFFSLLHTHGNTNSTVLELVDGSNCDTTGDGICDTPADPGLSLQTIDNFCAYVGSEKDANGNVYRPDTKNIMSYSRKACRNHFTPQQLARMYGFYKTIKSDIDPEYIDDTSQSLADIKIYPNPVKGNIIHIDRNVSNSNNPLHFEIINLSGQRLLKGMSYNETINVSVLPSGSYFLILSNSGYRITKKIIK